MSQRVPLAEISTRSVKTVGRRGDYFCRQLEGFQQGKLASYRSATGMVGIPQIMPQSNMLALLNPLICDALLIIAVKGLKKKSLVSYLPGSQLQHSLQGPIQPGLWVQLA